MFVRNFEDDTLKLIFMSGLPAVGKLTVAKELSEITEYKLFHNHLAVDLLLAVFEFGSEPFVELRESIWLSVFEQAGRAGLPGLIFTFNAENSVRQTFIGKMQEVVRANGGTICFVELICDEEELRRRLDTPARRQYGKLKSWEKYQELKVAGTFATPILPAPELVVNTGKLEARSAAKQIAEHCGGRA